MGNQPGVPYALVGSGLTKTQDIGGSRFGAWSFKAFSPTSYVQETLSTPVYQLSIPPNYSNLGSYGAVGTGPGPAANNAASASPMSPQSPVFWVVMAVVFLGTLFVLKRKGKIK
jgi:hypothetical protein